MDCIGCEMNAVRALEELNGVEKAEASFPEKRATIYFDETKITPEEMCQALFKIGFVGRPSED